MYQLLQRLENYLPQAKSDPLPIFENEVLLEHKYIYLITRVVHDCLHATMAELSNCDRNIYPQGLKYLLSVLLKKKAANPWDKTSKFVWTYLIQVGMGFASPDPCIGGGGGGSCGLTKTLSSALVRSSLIWLNGKAESE